MSPNPEKDVATPAAEPVDTGAPEVAEQPVPKDFTYHAHQKMIDLFENHDHEVGSELYKEDPEQYADFDRTNCITYVMNCISHGFKMSGHPDAAKLVWDYIIRGVDLASYLVQRHDWECIYINPDVKHPRDGDSEHPFSYYIVKKQCMYYGLPVFATAINYAPTKEAETIDGIVEYSRDQRTKQNRKDLKKLNNIKFGFGLSRGGTHTWLFSDGDVYEVHWASIGDDLYEKRKLKDFPWLSSVIVVPPETARVLRTEGLSLCRR